MTSVLEIMLRVGGTVLGVLCLYVAFFLYEDEEGRLQNILENLWIRVADRSDGTSIAIRRLAGESSRLTSHALDRVFGEKILSPQAIGVSFCYGAASIATYPIVLFGGPAARGAIWIVPLIFVVLGSLPALHNNRLTTRAVFLPTLAFVAFFLLATAQLGWLILDGTTDDTGLFAGCAGVAAALIVAIAGDFGWIVLVRKTFSSANLEMPLRRMIALILVNSIALAFGLLPIIWRGVFARPLAPDPTSIFAEVFVFLLITSRLFVTATALLFLATLITILLHRLLWPLVDRAVYAVARHKLLQNRKRVGTLGLALIIACAWNSTVPLWFARAVGLA